MDTIETDNDNDNVNDNDNENDNDNGNDNENESTGQPTTNIAVSYPLLTDTIGLVEING